MNKYSLLILLLFSAYQANAQKNLITNGGFEDGLNGWTEGGTKVSTVIRKSGDASLAIVSYVQGKWQGTDQKVKIPKNAKAIAVSGFCKSDHVEQGNNSWNTALIILEFIDGDKKIGEGIPIVQKTGTEDWNAFRKNFKVPDGATSFRIMIALSEASGTFFVDDLTASTIPIEDFEKEAGMLKTN